MRRSEQSAADRPRLPPPALPERRSPAPKPRRSNLRASLLTAGLLGLAGLAGFAAMLGRDGPLAPALAALDARLAAAPRALSADERAALYLVRSTLLTLDDANRTGNYTVLRLLAAPSFRAMNSPERLADVFAAQRRQGLDLSVAAFDAPVWSTPPSVGPDRLLRLVGRYPAAGDSIRFALAFEPSGGAWRLYEVIVGTEPEPEAESRVRTSQLVNAP